MLSTLFSLAVLSLHAGDVCSIPDGVALVQPGKLNWALRDPAFSVPPGTRAIVVRIAPQGIPDVAEVKVYDGTNRLGWIETSGLAPVAVVVARQIPAARPAPAEKLVLAPDAVKPYGVQVQRRRSRRRLPDFSAVDDAIAGMAAQSQAAYDQQLSRQEASRQSLMNSGRTSSGGVGYGSGGFGSVGSGGRSQQSHLCGAPTKTTDGPCKNRVLGPGYCNVHR